MILTPTGPYDLGLSLRAALSFGPGRLGPPADPPPSLRSAVRIDGAATILEVSQVADEPPSLEATSRPAVATGALAAMTRRLVNADLDLLPFYQRATEHPILGPLTLSLRGLKAFRPPTLFEMLVIAVIEQQISLAAAYHIRERLVERFGEPVDGLAVFPSPDVLAEASSGALTECGLSRRKAEYLGGLAETVTTGGVSLEALEGLSDDDVRARVTAIRGFGPWSADYLLVRGLGRPDVVPVDDLGIQNLTGRALGTGSRSTPDEVRRLLEPLAPFRGLAVFYLLAASRLSLL
jgi:DNA-3-methyladenine glycosylase II